MEKIIKKKIRGMEDGEWYWISRDILEKYASKIGCIGLAIYNVYASFARDKGYAFPSQKKIAKLLKISIPTLIKYNKILEENGLIKIEKDREKQRTNMVYLLKMFKSAPKKDLVGDVKEIETKEKNIKENTIEVDDKSSLVKNIISFFKYKTKEAKGYEPEIDFAKDGKIVKQRLKKYTREEIEEMIDWYLHSSYSEKFGSSLSICLSSNMINLWKASKKSSSYLDKLYPKYG